MPRERLQAIVCPKCKNGEPTECKNYRDTSLINTVLPICIKRRLEKALEQITVEYQEEFRRGRSGTDQIFALRDIIAESHQYSLMVYALVVDFCQAYGFDTILRDRLYDAMK